MPLPDDVPLPVDVPDELLLEVETGGGLAPGGLKSR